MLCQSGVDEAPPVPDLTVIAAHLNTFLLGQSISAMTCCHIKHWSRLSGVAHASDQAFALLGFRIDDAVGSGSLRTRRSVAMFSLHPGRSARACNAWVTAKFSTNEEAAPVADCGVVYTRQSPSFSPVHTVQRHSGTREAAWITEITWTCTVAASVAAGGR